jgi:NAD(P)-dependent dehydrogenase (short-subunit alcohol dehydrogenase family)
MTKAAALDYAKKNVRVNAVGPGPVETPLLAKGTGGDPHSYAAFVPMGRIGQPEGCGPAPRHLNPRQGRRGGGRRGVPGQHTRGVASGSVGRVSLADSGSPPRYAERARRGVG